MTRTGHDLDAAAAVLGISKEALRKRIKRGSIEATKDNAGRWQVYIEDTRPDAGEDTRPDNVQDAVLDAYRTTLDAQNRHIEFLQKELERRGDEIYRKDRIILDLTQKIPQLEAPKEPTVYDESIDADIREENEKPAAHEASLDKAPDTTKESGTRPWWQFWK